MSGGIGALVPSTILLIGAPRSGTTWLGKIFDSHPDVLYRHEPDETQPPPADLTDAALPGVVADWIAQHDQRTAGKRPWFRKSWQFPGVFHVRSALALALAAASRLPIAGHWAARLKLPDLARIDRAARLRVVLKSNGWCAGAGHFARCLPQSRTILILRHPCAQVASLMRGARQRRFELKQAGTDMPYDEVAAAACAAGYGVSSAAYQALPDAGKYAWAWVAFNEMASSGLAGLPNARVVLYEELCARPEAVARELFDFAGLAWNSQTADFLARSTSHAGSAGYYAVFRNSAAAAQAWRATMPAADQQAVRQVVGQVRLAGLWPDLTQNTA